MKPLLSIVIPTLQEENAIHDMITRLRIGIQSIPYEIIIADGRSTDKTVDIARSLADKVIISESTHPSPARQRNEGGRAASGEIIAFLDCDVSMPHPESFFVHALWRFRTDPQLVGLTGPQRTLPEFEKWADRINWGILNLMIRTMNNVLHRGEVSGKLMIARKSAFDHVHGLRDDLITREDANFFLRLSYIGKTRFDPELMIYHHARRAHRIGWWKLWGIWTWNTIYVALFDRAWTDAWRPIR